MEDNNYMTVKMMVTKFVFLYIHRYVLIFYANKVYFMGLLRNKINQFHFLRYRPPDNTMGFSFKKVLRQ